MNQSRLGGEVKLEGGVDYQRAIFLEAMLR